MCGLTEKAVSWGTLLACNGWQWDSQKSYEEDYGYYYAEICGNEYFNVGCWARVSDGAKGVKACGDYGIAWIECDISTYTSRDYLTVRDALEVLHAVENAENNLLRCGVPFTKDYRFHGKNAANKARRNAAMRKKRRIEY